jgi:hypothetical protein
MADFFHHAVTHRLDRASPGESPKLTNGEEKGEVSGAGG